MIKRTLVFSNPTYLSLRNSQLVISFPDAEKEEKTVAIEDIGVLLLEHQK